MQQVETASNRQYPVSNKGRRGAGDVNNLRLACQTMGVSISQSELLYNA
jgi:hypothetical protein